MKILRRISPFLAFSLALLMLAGSTGLTLVKHRCNYCGKVEIMTSISLAAKGDDCCCHHQGNHTSHNHHADGFVYDNDCCSHEVENLMTREVVKTELQKEVVPFFMVASIIAVIPTYHDSPESHAIRAYTTLPDHDLTSFYCQILS